MQRNAGKSAGTGCEWGTRHAGSFVRGNVPADLHLISRYFDDDDELRCAIGWNMLGEKIFVQKPRCEPIRSKYVDGPSFTVRPFKVESGFNGGGKLEVVKLRLFQRSEKILIDN